MTTLIENTFTCADCGQVKPVQTNGGTGYAIKADDSKVCYDCCAIADKAHMLATGKAMLYLSRDAGGIQHGNFPFNQQPDKPVWTVGNWPGSLKISAFVKVGRHNIAGSRYDAWFTGPDDKQWHGVTYGDDTEICHCKRIKG
jgi:hypothetical protein